MMTSFVDVIPKPPKYRERVQDKYYQVVRLTLYAFTHPLFADPKEARRRR